MTFANLSTAWVLAGLAGLAAGLFALQQLRTRYRDLTVVTTMFWKQVIDEAPVRTLRERFRHPWAYGLVLLISALCWLALAEPRFDRGRDRTFHVLILDGSAGMAAGTRFGQAVTELQREVARLPAAQRQVIWAGGEIRPLLAPGEHDLLLRRRLEGRTPDAAPASVERLLRQLSASHAGDPATSIVIFGDAPITPQVTALLPPTVTLARAAAATPLSGNAGVTALGVSDAASGAWDQVDVFIGLESTSDRPAPAVQDVQIDVDGRALSGAAAAATAHGQSLVIRDVPAQGGLLTVRLAGADSLPLDNVASVRLPARPIVKVLLSASLTSVLGPVLAADRGVLVSRDAGAIAIRRAGEPIGAGLPALEFVGAAAQPQAFLITHPDAFDRAAVLKDAVADIGLTQIDAMSLAQASGRAIEVSIASGRQWRFSVWEDLLSDDYDFTRSRAFPVFVAKAVRWLAGVRAWYPSVAAGRALATNIAGERGHVLSAGGRVLDPPGVDFVAGGAGPLRLDAGFKPLSVSLLDPALTSGAHDAPAVLASLSPAGFAPEMGVSTWLLLIAAALLAWEWRLYQRGRLP